MKKRVPILVTVILCAVFLFVGIAGTEIFHELRADFRSALPPVNGGQTASPPGNTPDTPPSGSPEATNPSKNFIGEERAKEIALEKAALSASEVRFDRVELDLDDGVWRYEVEFRQGLTEYDADISATDGTILSWDVDHFD